MEQWRWVEAAAISDKHNKKAPQTAERLRRFGAGNGSRTHLSTLGRSHSTDELYPQIVFYILTKERSFVNRKMKKTGNFTGGTG